MPKAAREARAGALERFWRRVSRGGALQPAAAHARSTCCSAAGRSTIRRSSSPWTCMARLFSPYDLNPRGANPLREILARDASTSSGWRSAPIKLFITATNVRTGRGRVFRNAEITPDVLLASACLPTHVPGGRDRRRGLLGRRLFRQSRPSRRWSASAHRTTRSWCRSTRSSAPARRARRATSSTA